VRKTGLEGNAQSDRPGKQTEQSETAKKVSRLTAALKDRSYWPDQQRAAEALGQMGSAAKDAVPALVAALKDPEPYVRYAAVRALDKIGEFSPKTLAALRTAAEDEESLVRDAAIEAFESLWGKATKSDVPARITALKNTDSLVRRAAARALGQDGAITPETLAALKAATKDEKPSVRDAAMDACESLLHKATRGDLPTIVAALAGKEPFIRRAATRALDKLGVFSISADALAALKVVTKDDDPLVRRTAIEAYARIYARLMSKPTEEDASVLVVLKDAEPIARRDAARALGSVGSLSATPKALVALKAAAEDEAPLVRNAAIEACESILDRATRTDAPVLLAALNDSKPFVRRDAARALGRVGYYSPEALVALKAAAKDKQPPVRDAAIEAYEVLLGRIPQKDVPALLVALKDAEPFVRRAAARVLGQVGAYSPEALAALKTTAKDEKAPVRDAAIEAYESLMGRATRKDVPSLIAELKDTESPLRPAAAGALGEVGALSSSPEVLPVLKGAMKDKAPNLRRAAIAAYQRLMSRATREGVPALIAALKDAEPFVRRDAAGALGRVGGPTAEALAALKVAARDEQLSVRDAATEAYERLMGRATRNDVAVLIADLKDSQPFVRRAAAAELGNVGVTSPEAWAALKTAGKDSRSPPCGGARPAR
jgi:HEAT repeat protein